MSWLPEYGELAERCGYGLEKRGEATDVARSDRDEVAAKQEHVGPEIGERHAGLFQQAVVRESAGVKVRREGDSQRGLIRPGAARDLERQRGGPKLALEAERVREPRTPVCRPEECLDNGLDRPPVLASEGPIGGCGDRGVGHRLA